MNWITSDGTWDSFRMWAGCQRKNTGLELSVSSSSEEKGAADWVCHQWPMISSSTPMKRNLHKSVFSSFLVGEPTHVPLGWHTLMPQQQKLLPSGCFGTSRYVPLHVAVHLYPYNILCKKSVNESSVSLGSVSCFNKLSVWGMGCRNSCFIFKVDRTVGNLGTHYFWLPSEMRTASWNWALNLWGLH